MMFNVIFFERDCDRNAERQICKYAEETIGERRRVAKRRVVADVVDGERETVVDEAAEKVGLREDEEPRRVCSRRLRDCGAQTLFYLGAPRTQSLARSRSQ